LLKQQITNKKINKRRLLWHCSHFRWLYRLSWKTISK